jgi:hypothetical protein
VLQPTRSIDLTDDALKEVSLIAREPNGPRIVMVLVFQSQIRTACPKPYLRTDEEELMQKPDRLGVTVLVASRVWLFMLSYLRRYAKHRSRRQLWCPWYAVPGVAVLDAPSSSGLRLR